MANVERLRLGHAACNLRLNLQPYIYRNPHSEVRNMHYASISSLNLPYRLSIVLCLEDARAQDEDVAAGP